MAGELWTPGVSPSEHLLSPLKPWSKPSLEVAYSPVSVSDESVTGQGQPEPSPWRPGCRLEFTHSPEGPRPGVNVPAIDIYITLWCRQTAKRLDAAAPRTSLPDTACRCQWGEREITSPPGPPRPRWGVGGDKESSARIAMAIGTALPGREQLAHFPGVGRRVRGFQQSDSTRQH